MCAKRLSQWRRSFVSVIEVKKHNKFATKGKRFTHTTDVFFLCYKQNEIHLFLHILQILCMFIITFLNRKTDY